MHVRRPLGSNQVILSPRTSQRTLHVSKRLEFLFESTKSSVPRRDGSFENRWGRRQRQRRVPAAPLWCVRPGSHETLILKDRKSKELVELKLKSRDQVAKVRPGKVVRVTGQKNKGRLEVEAYEMFESSPTNTPEDGGPVPPIPSGGRKVLVFLVQLRDGVPYLTRDQANSFLFGASNSVKALFRAQTKGQVDLDSDTNRDGTSDILPVTLDSSGATCSFANWATLAIEQARALGIDDGAYEHHLFILPNTVACGWAGIATVGSTLSWVRAGGPAVIAHELGHNLGLLHAATDPDNDGFINSEYGDSSCLMGSAFSLRGFNAPHRHQLKVPLDIRPGLTQSTFEIQSLESDPALALAPQVLTIPKANSNEVYVLSYRRPIGFDTALPSFYFGGLSIHVTDPTFTAKTKLIRVIAPGESFHDPANGVVIRALATDPVRQSISISLGEETPASACTTRTAELAISPSSFRIGRSGQVTTTLTIKNNDSEGCEPTTFGISNSAVDGVVVELPRETVTLAPGESVLVDANISYAGLYESADVAFVLRDIDGDTNSHVDLSDDVSLIFDGSNSWKLFRTK